MPIYPTPSTHPCRITTSTCHTSIFLSFPLAATTGPIELSLPHTSPEEGTPPSGTMAFAVHGGCRVSSSSSRAAAAAVMVVVAAALAVTARGDFAADRAECANQLMGLATCLTFVQDKATARAPTPDCCAGLKQVVSASKKCMCVLVKDRDEPALGFKINVTRAMDLPAICNYAATFSDCPKILGMSPNAPEAEIFKEYARKHESQNGTTQTAAATGAAGGKSASSSPTGGAGAGSQPSAVIVYLGSALLALALV